jgi:hypothetical protein
MGLNKCATAFVIQRMLKNGQSDDAHRRKNAVKSEELFSRKTRGITTHLLWFVTDCSTGNMASALLKLFLAKTLTLELV